MVNYKWNEIWFCVTKNAFLRLKLVLFPGENKKLENALYSFMVEALKKQISFGIDTSVCYCIGSGENFKFLTNMNETYHFFDKIIPLEHPRFIMQYHSKDKDQYLKKYMESFCN